MYTLLQLHNYTTAVDSRHYYNMTYNYRSPDPSAAHPGCSHVINFQGVVTCHVSLHVQWNVECFGANKCKAYSCEMQLNIIWIVNAAQLKWEGISLSYVYINHLNMFLNCLTKTIGKNSFIFSQTNSKSRWASQQTKYSWFCVNNLWWLLMSKVHVSVDLI